MGDDYLLDERLVRHDVRASIAHARMLQGQGYLSTDNLEKLTRALGEIEAEHARGEWHISIQEEDVHTALEARLIDRLGDLGGRIHLGRSRNDQVLAALRLYLQEVCEEVEANVELLVQALDEIAVKQGEVPLPGYTHMQRAMPSSVALWANGFSASLHESLQALETPRAWCSLNPLGSAAGYGTPGLELDRTKTTEYLGFSLTQEPVTAVQQSRGKAEAALAFALMIVMQDVGRLAADLCLFATSEFAFVKLPAEFTTGSSIMPQKRNPDVFELLRDRSAQAPSDLLAIIEVTSKLTSGYHRDLQLIKPPLFRAIDTALLCLNVAAKAVAGVKFSPSDTNAAMTEDLYAAERAFDLVKSKGISFRDAYRQVARNRRATP